MLPVDPICTADGFIAHLTRRVSLTQLVLRRQDTLSALLGNEVGVEPYVTTQVHRSVRHWRQSVSD